MLMEASRRLSCEFAQEAAGWARRLNCDCVITLSLAVYFVPNTTSYVWWSENVTNLPTPREPLHSALPPSLLAPGQCGAAMPLSACRCLAVVDTLDTSIRKKITPRELTLLRNGIDVGRKVNGDVDASRTTSHFTLQVTVCYVVR